MKVRCVVKLVQEVEVEVPDDEVRPLAGVLEAFILEARCVVVEKPLSIAVERITVEKVTREWVPVRAAAPVP